jgi:hypothetical protein
MSESPLIMFAHSAFIAVILFLILFYGAQLQYKVANAWSNLIGALLFAYMIVFGHKLPSIGNINKYLV